MNTVSSKAFIAYNVASTRTSFRDFPLWYMYEMMGGSLKISLSCSWLAIRCYFPMSVSFRLGNAGWYCVKKSSIFLRALLFSVLATFLYKRIYRVISERCFSTILAWENSRHFAASPLVSPQNDVWETTAEIPYWWRITTQIWVVLLIGWSKFWTNQTHYPDLGGDASSVWNFCSRFSDVISWGNQWWRREMSAVFSGYDNSSWVIFNLPILQTCFEITHVFLKSNLGGLCSQKP